MPSTSSAQWLVCPSAELPDDFLQAVGQAAGFPAESAAQLLWQRGIGDRTSLAGFLNPNHYQPTSPFAFGEEMEWAIARLQLARDKSESVVIWGDFDADGITATAVLWEGLGQFFPAEQLSYFIPNRLTESHGLSQAGLEAIAHQGASLIVTCDTGSSNALELELARQLGIDVIITDHHSLPMERPPVDAFINPRSLPVEHPLAHLSGVAVAYKLVEALYLTFPEIPQRPLEQLLDLVAIGLIADLVKLSGDCRYLAQRGIERLQLNQTQDPPPRPGIARLLQLCQRNGDRPTDISFGLGPRINAISRIHGDARFCVELLTSADAATCRKLAEETELANSRRKALQKDLAQQVRDRLLHQDLSTTRVIVLGDSQWPIGVLGLVAGQIAQEYGRPTILLAEESDPEAEGGAIARGSARSVAGIDLQRLVQQQAHFLQGWGGHPQVLGIRLRVAQIPLFAEALNQALRQQYPLEGRLVPTLQADLIVSVADLGQPLFRQLKLLEPYGMGNPVPRLLVQNCWFEKVWHRNQEDWRGRKIRYIKTEFELWDEHGDRGFPGIWWEHYKEEVPSGRCDAIVELDFNAFKKRYEVRLIAVRPTQLTAPLLPQVDWILDWRSLPPDQRPTSSHCLILDTCPSSWNEMQAWFRLAVESGQELAIAYPPPNFRSPTEIWETLVGLAKYLSRTGTSVTHGQLRDKLEIGDRTLQVGLTTLQQLPFVISEHEDKVLIEERAIAESVVEEAVIEQEEQGQDAIALFLKAIQEEQFHRRYFSEIPLSTLKAVADQVLRG
ncbi:MAG: single-stranded-DNA-specific exonuclease RecJ [Oculatellaceae cyanobacterium Prado106]|jgi:single-stranded-DNA-specific exonuclease|nr:single-stranded-DNA-specific exonuclease RecJ [Oculatellaceae cyanobacterium Prado106]